MQSAGRRRRQLVDTMRQDGVLTDPGWIEAFRRVPRHAFVPRCFVPDGGNNAAWAALDSSDDGWLAEIYADQVLVTQLDDRPSAWETARRTGPVRGTPTCSSSMPTIMAIMLEELLVTTGDRVLEVGTGTGYNAALLCQRLGSANVSTVDVDADLVRAAKTRLNACGYHPACEICDGAKGFPANATYDRVLCTCSVSAIPVAWLEQTVPGGLIVTTLNRPIGAGLVRITVGEGATGYGQVLPRDGRFMPLRAHRLSDAGRMLATADRGHGYRRSTKLSIRDVLNPASRFEFFAGLALPQVAPAFDPAKPSATFLVHADGSWVRHEQDAITQGGPRRLWDLVEAAHRDWQALGEPARDRFGITVTPDYQELWLDTPDSEHRWPLRGG